MFSSNVKVTVAELQMGEKVKYQSHVTKAIETCDSLTWWQDKVLSNSTILDTSKVSVGEHECVQYKLIIEKPKPEK